MPFLKEIKNPHHKIILWKKEESEFPTLSLERELNLSKKQIFNRFITNQIIKLEYPSHSLHHDEDRAPYLIPLSSFVSISHSQDLIAVGFSKTKIGIDIEYISERIVKIKDKFTNTNEQKWIPNQNLKEYLTCIWCIKESLYKIHDAKFYSFKEHYEVFPFELEKSEKIKCRVYDEKKETFFEAKIETIDNFFLCSITG